MSDIEAMKSLVLHIAQHLVDRPDEVVVDAIEESSGAVTLRLRAGRGEAGKIIGKQGRTARILRTIISGAAMRLTVKIN